MIYENKKPEYILITILIVGLFLITASFFRQLNFPDTKYILKKGQRVEIIPGDILQQKFIANDNGLSNLKILFGGKPLAKGYTLDLILTDEDCTKELRRTTLRDKQKFNSKYLYDFKFSRIDDSKNKKYCLKIVYKTTAENPKKKEVRLFTNNWQNTYDQQVNNGVVKENGIILENYVLTGKTKSQKDEQGDAPITFRPSYKNETILQDFQQLNQRMSQYKPWFLKGGYFVMIFLGGLILSTMSVITLFKSFGKRQNE